MKPLITVVALLTALPAFAQNSDTKIPAKPRLQTSAEDIVHRHTTSLGERQVTFEKVRPLALPPIPEPPVVEVDPQRLEEIQAAAIEYANTHRSMFVGATVYIPESGPAAAKSLVRYWPQPGEPAVSMWVNANMIWLGCFSEFERNGITYSLMMLPTEIRLDTMREFALRTGREWQAPELPEFSADGTGELLIVEGNPSPADLAPFQAMMQHYRDNTAQLQAAHEQRLLEAKARRLEREANPPEQKDLRIRYWRLDQPAEKPATIR